jgi:hypothetical protein
MYRAILTAVFSLVLIPLAALAIDPTAYVVNTNGETLSKINLRTGSVDNNFLTIGTGVYSFPNQIVVRDTLAFVIASGTDEMQIVNLNTEQTEYFINTGASSNPYWIDFADEQYLYITLMMKNSVAKVDWLSGTAESEVVVGKSPEGIIIVGDKAYIACTGFDFDTWQYDPGEVSVYDIPADTMIRTIAVGLNPQYLDLDDSGRIHVVCTGDYATVFGCIYLIDIRKEVIVDSIKLGGTPGQISIGPDNVAYVAAAGWSQDGYVYSYNAASGEVYHDANNPLEVDQNCLTVAAFQDSTVFTGSFTDYVNVVDSSGANLHRYAVGDGPVHLDFNYVPGDADGDFQLNLADVTCIINWLYKNGPEPRWPGWRANADGDQTYNILDAAYILNYLYRDGPRPRMGPRWLMW